MQVELVIRADSLSELSHIFARSEPLGDRPSVIKEIEPEDPPIEEEPEVPAPKKPRSSRAKAPTAGTVEPSSTEESQAGSKSSATVADENTAPEKVTFEDLRAAAGPIMDRGDSRAIQEMLLAKFDVRAFGALKPEQYGNALAELKNLSE